MPEDTVPHARTRPRAGGWRRAAAAALLFAAGAVVFLLAARTGGITWDEPVHRMGAVAQFAVAGNWLAGEPADFREIVVDLAFYGTIPTAIVTVIDSVWRDAAGTGMSTLTFGIWLHALSFLLYGVTIALVFAALRAATTSPAVPWLGAGFLMLYPLWLGLGLFDYKDVPTAAFVMLVVYCAGRAMAAEDRDFVRWTILAALGTIALGGTKAAAVALVIVPWVALTSAAFARRHRALPFLAAAGIILGLVVVTPAAWAEPVAFFRTAVTLMSRHPWDGCTLTDGVCLSPGAANWSAAHYLWKWASVQLPVTMIAGLVPALGIALWRGGMGRLAAATLLFTVAAIVVRNTTLYDGLRHVAFVIPLAVLVLFVGIDYAVTRWGRPAAIVLFGLVGLEMATFAIDDVRLFPYNYAYFNVAARGGIDETRYDTDFWGFSARETVMKAKAKDAIRRPMAGWPPHIFAVGFAPDNQIWTPAALLDSGRTGTYTHFSLSRRNARPAAECRIVAETRRTLLWGRTLRLSYAERCTL